MSRLFVTQREQSFISDITKEVFRDVVGQKVYYYSISEIHTRSELYNESASKIWDSALELPALVSSPERNVKTDIFGPEHYSKVEVYLHWRDLTDLGVNITVGDFLRYSDTVYEISNIINMRNIYGHAETTDGLKLECIQARKGQIDPPQVGPSDVIYTDDGAVQKTFEQTRGNEIMDGQVTGDVRDLQKNGVLEKPVSGPNNIVSDEKTGSDFYGDKW